MSIQFVIHLSVLIYLVNLCEPHIDRLSDESLVPDGEFKPNVKNSVSIPVSVVAVMHSILCELPRKTFHAGLGGKQEALQLHKTDVLGGHLRDP